MIMKMFTVFDRKASAHLQPFYARSDAEAVRMLKETLLRGDSGLSKFPDDYHLYGIGEFDDQTGEVLGCTHPEPIASISEVLEQGLREVRSRAERMPPVSAAQLDLEDAMASKKEAAE